MKQVWVAPLRRRGSDCLGNKMDPLTTGSPPPKKNLDTARGDISQSLGASNGGGYHTPVCTHFGVSMQKSSIAASILPS